MIEMNYRKSVPFDMDNVAKTNPDADAFAAGETGQGKYRFHGVLCTIFAYTSLFFF